MPGERALIVRDAARDEVPAIVALYRTDELTRKHAHASPSEVETGYYTAFDMIASDARNRLLVAVTAGEIVGSFQLTYVPDMQPDGREVAIVENVIVHAKSRGSGIGAAMMRWAVETARARNCSQVKLTSSKKRADAHRFYARLGFEATHEGFKLLL
jgi:GNAT superfamily N-acetyltransferase